MVGVRPRDLAGQLRGHVGVAVAVATDPGAPAQEGRHSRRPRPAEAGVARQLELGSAFRGAFCSAPCRALTSGRTAGGIGACGAGQGHGGSALARSPGHGRVGPIGPIGIVGRGRCGSCGLEVAAGAIEGAIEGSIDPRHRSEDRFVEIGEGRANLVHRLGGELANRRRAPQQADLLTQAATDLGRS